MKENEYISKIKELESIITDQRVKIARLNATIEEYQRKEQSISSAIVASMEHANQMEANRKKLYMLDIQRSRLMYLRMEQIINELYIKYPELKKDTKLIDLNEKFKSMVYSGLNESATGDYVASDIKKPITDDPIKKLLHNIIDCFDSKKSGKEEKRGEPSDELLNNVSSSGFDFNEALHPTMELEEIMKYFNLTPKKNTSKK